VTINVVVSDQVLLGDQDGAAEIDGYGPVPASLARHLASAPPDAAVAIRRLYATPTSGALVAMDSTSRCFPAGLATYIRLRDRTCRTPWCDAPVRHTDHIQPASKTGPPPPTTGKGCAKPATTPNKHPAGPNNTSTPAPRGTMTS
jgi:hypothetical protein